MEYISKEVIVAIVTGIFSLIGILLNLNKQTKSNVDIDEWKYWRKEIRNLSVKLSLFDMSSLNSKQESDFLKCLNTVKSRINPYGIFSTDYMKDCHIWNSLSILENSETRNNTEKNKLINFLLLLLKYDWERSKNKSNINSCAIVGYCVYIISNVVFTYLFFSNEPAANLSSAVFIMLIFAAIFFAPQINLLIYEKGLTFFLDFILSYGIPIAILLFINFHFAKDNISWLIIPTFLQIASLIFLFFSKFNFYINMYMYKKKIKELEKNTEKITIIKRIKQKVSSCFYYGISKGEIIMHKKSFGFWFFNIIHLVILMFLMFFIFRAVLCVDTGMVKTGFWQDIMQSIKNAGSTEWFNFIGAVAFVLFGINGIYEFCYSNGITFFVPPIYRLAKDSMLLKQAEKMMNLYYNKDIEFIKTYEDARTTKILNTLQLTDKQFHHIRYEILKARAETPTNIKKIKGIARKLILNKEFIIDLTKVEVSKRIYSDVDYYIDLYTALLDDDVCEDIGNIMYNYLHYEIKNKVNEIDCIVVPYGSNLRLALSVAQKLDVRLISILRDGRMLNNQPWDGEFPIKKDGEKLNIVMLHDVLVSGERIYKSLEKLPEDSYELIGLFSLVYYKTNNNPYAILDSHGIPQNKIHNILEVSDEDMEVIVSEKDT